MVKKLKVKKVNKKNMERAKGSVCEGVKNLIFVKPLMAECPQLRAKIEDAFAVWLPAVTTYSEVGLMIKHVESMSNENSIIEKVDSKSGKA
jgi:hypothetical protein